MKMRSIYFTFILLGCLVFTAVNAAENKTVYFVSLNWPPSSGADLPDQGACVLVARKAFAAMGYNLQVEFFSWSKTLDKVKEEKYSGYFPEYWNREIQKNFMFSDPIGYSILGFAERKSDPVNWKKLTDLKNAGNIGVVYGYVNEINFDKIAAAKEIKTEYVENDYLNLRKIAAKRIRMAVIDKRVMEYYLRTDETLKEMNVELQFNARILETKGVYLCFKNTPEGKRLHRIFNQGLRKINSEKINEAYYLQFY